MWIHLKRATTASILGRGACTRTALHHDPGPDCPRYRLAVPVGESAGAIASRPQGLTEPSVRVRDVAKTFVVPRHKVRTVKEHLRHPIASFGHDRFEALRGVSFEVQPGEFFAVIGRNGSGKSTLLRCIAGIYDLDGGEVDVDARITPFIELGVGFQPQLAAQDNVMVAGTLLGLRPGEARERFPEVISFAELEEFADMPIANYSSGMQQRLAFSTSFQVEAEVLLFDELLAVGDALFQRKCHLTFERLISRGHTILYVTHDLETVREFADRVLLLERGRMVSLGNPDAVIEEYERLNREHEQGGRMRLAEPDSQVEVLGAWIESEEGRPLSALRQGDDARFHFVVRLRRDGDRPAMGFALRDDEGRVVLSETNRWRTEARSPGLEGELHTFSAPFPHSVEPGAYDLVPLLVRSDEEGPIELPDNQLRIEVEPPEVMPGREDLQRLGGRAADGARSRARRFADVCLILARTEFKLRYLDSAVGYVWALGQPLLMFGVLYVIWTEVIQLGADTPHYGAGLLLGIALFNFFSEATGQALPSLLSKGRMLRAIPFPPVALPLSSVLTSAVTFGVSLAVAFGFIFANGITPSASWLEIVPLVLLLLAFTAGACMVLSLLYVPVRDVHQIWLVGIRLLFFATPVLYPIELASETLQRILLLNPLAVVIVEARHALIDPSAPSAAEAAGGAGWLAIPLAFTAALLIAGLRLYQTRARRLAERV
jgi:ABC-type polysaccharide/polyol phosphate transport system ATPase subunit/ABC-type polysaccharide/polyol phosphate export permease